MICKALSLSPADLPGFETPPEFAPRYGPGVCLLWGRIAAEDLRHVQQTSLKRTSCRLDCWFYEDLGVRWGFWSQPESNPGRLSSGLCQLCGRGQLASPVCTFISASVT